MRLVALQFVLVSVAALVSRKPSRLFQLFKNGGVAVLSDDTYWSDKIKIPSGGQLYIQCSWAPGEHKFSKYADVVVEFSLRKILMSRMASMTI